MSDLWVPDPDQFIELLKEMMAEPDDPFTLGTIAAVSGQTATVTFDNGTTSSKYFPVAYSYAPIVGHRVILASVGHTWVVLDRIG